MKNLISKKVPKNPLKRIGASLGNGIFKVSQPALFSTFSSPLFKVPKTSTKFNILKSHNFQSFKITKNYSTELWNQRHSHEFINSVKKSLSILSSRGGWTYSEAYVPNADETKAVLMDTWLSTGNETTPSVEAPLKGTLIGDVWKTKKPILMPNLSTVQNPEISPLIKKGLKSGAIVPVVTNKDQVITVLAFYSTQSLTDLASVVDSISSMAVGLIGSGIASVRNAGVEFKTTGGVAEEQLKEVFNKICETGVFNTNIVYEEVYRFYNELGFPKDYFTHSTPDELANFVHSYIAAKRVAETLDNPENIYMERIRSDHHLYLCPVDDRSILDVERRIEAAIKALPKGKTYSVNAWCSTGTPVPGGKKLAFYKVNIEEFVNPNASEDESDIKKLSTGVFLKDISNDVREKYQQMLDFAKGKLSTRHSTRIEDHQANLIIVTRTNFSFLSFFSEVITGIGGLEWNRKFVNTFSNGLNAYSIYFKISPNTDKITIESKLHSLAHQLGLISVIPQGTRITPLFVDKILNAEEFSYAMAVSRFIYYFMQAKPEEYEMLAKFLKSDPVNLGRLDNMHNKLRSAAVSPARIQECLNSYHELIRELYRDFKHYRVPGKKIVGQMPKFNEELAKKIHKTVTNDIDEAILNGFLRFNENCLKTNFFKSFKSSLSFRLGQNILQPGDVSQVPYGIFWVLGPDFQGFHVRLRDVARGGIRMITSANDIIYNKNAESQFTENYNLAYTQNKKNKDIPEFGSKGTILLYRNHVGDTFLPFKKYTAGLLDLLVEADRVWYNDYYGTTEVLFLGPDEGTAEYMEWAATYAKRRGYQFWRAFTTGKPPTMGGIPHDMFGMTTRSVHKNVLSCLKTHGLAEENITKLQTGGPDGDLGSNEILISKDKTIAIVDGSGVVFDPKGLDRTELARLAKIRKMVVQFDDKFLSKDGFKVLLDDVNKRLPTGEIVENGRKFRDEFHLHPLSSADLFVPCGGRPGAVNLSNVSRLLNEDGTPRFKFIIEGANLFFTQDARQVLEKHGVILMKDASANKGGVTSSSLEVLAALSMGEEEFAQHMMVPDLKNPPLFYTLYVREIQEIIERNAELEFECIDKEHKKTGTPRYLLTDIVSDKINNLNDMINNSSLYDNLELRTRVLLHALPKILVSTIGLSNITKRVPENYVRAIFSSNLAATYVYKFGVDAPEIAFFEFMYNLLNPGRGSIF